MQSLLMDLESCENLKWKGNTVQYIFVIFELISFRIERSTSIIVALSAGLIGMNLRKFVVLELMVLHFIVNLLITYCTIYILQY